MKEHIFNQAPAHFPTTAASFPVLGSAGPLEVATDWPTEVAPRKGVAIICHPHPAHGGTMHNKVVTTVKRALDEAGIKTVRFNFRGVGESAGSFDAGRGEADDLLAVAAWTKTVCPDDDLWLAGFSFGSYIAFSKAVELEAKALITIAPPAGRKEDDLYAFDAAPMPDCPWLVVQGEEDEIVDPEAVFNWLEGIEREVTLIRMPETGHFFHRRLLDLRGAVKNAIRTWLPEESRS